MRENFRCGDHEALITFLYDEGDAAEREAMAVHVARCPSCADEIASLRSTRTMLAAWSPPDASLGFRMTRAEEQLEPVVLRPAAWWRQPLPAWAQAAAAVLIFAAGMMFGRAGGAPGGGVQTSAETARAAVSAPAEVTSAPAASVSASAVPPAPVSAPLPAASGFAAGAQPGPVAVSRDELARFEQRLRALESSAGAMRAQNVASRPDAVDERALLQQVQALLDDSEDRVRRENITMIGSIVRDFDLQRRVDLRQFEDQLGRIHDTARFSLRQQNEMVNYLMRNVSQTSVPAAGR